MTTANATALPTVRPHVPTPVRTSTSLAAEVDRLAIAAGAFRANAEVLEQVGNAAGGRVDRKMAEVLHGMAVEAFNEMLEVTAAEEQAHESGRCGLGCRCCPEVIV